MRAGRTDSRNQPAMATRPSFDEAQQTEKPRRQEGGFFPFAPAVMQAPNQQNPNKMPRQNPGQHPGLQQNPGMPNRQVLPGRIEGQNPQGAPRPQQGQRQMMEDPRLRRQREVKKDPDYLDENERADFPVSARQVIPSSPGAQGPREGDVKRQMLSQYGEQMTRPQTNVPTGFVAEKSEARKPMLFTPKKTGDTSGGGGGGLSYLLTAISQIKDKAQYPCQVLSRMYMVYRYIRPPPPPHY